MRVLAEFLPHRIKAAILILTERGWGEAQPQRVNTGNTLIFVRACRGWSRRHSRAPAIMRTAGINET
jgi:hypothetical protein